MSFDVGEPVGQKFSPFSLLAEDYADFRPAPASDCGRIIRTYIPDDATIVDLGCGTGKATVQLAGLFRHVTGVDLEERMLEYARLRSPPNITYIQADVSSAEGLPFERESIDACTAYSSLHWFSDDQSLQNILHALKPGGYLFVIRGGIKLEGEDYSKEERKGIKGAAMRFVQEILELPDDQFIVHEKNPLPLSVLTAKGFTFIGRRIVKDPDPIIYNIDQYVKYLKTFSEWNIVKKTSAETQAVVERELRTFLKGVVDLDGTIKIANLAPISILRKA